MLRIELVRLPLLMDGAYFWLSTAKDSRAGNGKLFKIYNSLSEAVMGFSPSICFPSAFFSPP